MESNAKDQRRDVSQNQFRDQNIINQGWMRDVHYHLPHPARDTPQPSPGPHFVVPFPENKRFVGREGILRRLKNSLFDDQRLCSTAVVGLGGVGKTQVALRIAYHARSQPSLSVFWLSALSMAAFEQACTEMVAKVRISTAGVKDAKQIFKGYLESSTSGKWLLIVDNADDLTIMMGPGGIYTYLPKSGNGCILFTTRAMDVALAVAEDDTKELEEMNEDEAKAFLQKLLQTSQVDNEMARELLHALTFLPLAISQAAAYMKRNKTSISRYLSLLRDVDKEAIGLLTREFPDRTRYPESRHAVASTWLVSFEQIQKQDEIAAELLSFLSQIEPQAVPESMLPRTRSEESFVNAIGTLYGYGFLNHRDNGEMLDMHSLVHLAAKEWVRGKGDPDAVKRKVTSHLATVFQSDDWDNREVWRGYMPHVLKAIEASTGGARWEEKECKLGYWAGRCAQVEGRIIEAVKLLEHVAKVRETTLAENHPDRLASQHALVLAYLANDQMKEALELGGHLVKVWETALVKNQPDQLASQQELPGVYKAKSHLENAIERLENLVKIEETTLSENHSSRLGLQQAQALAYWANGQVKDAVELLEHVVKIRETALAENHPDRLASQHKLAAAYRANGQVKEAVELLEHVVKIRETALAESHPDRLASQHELAAAFGANGQVKEAVELLEQVVKIKSKIMAPAHSSRQASQHLLEQFRRLY